MQTFIITGGSLELSSINRHSLIIKGLLNIYYSNIQCYHKSIVIFLKFQFTDISSFIKIGLLQL